MLKLLFDLIYAFCARLVQAVLSTEVLVSPVGPSLWSNGNK